jgi:hypothetical protein
MDGDTMLLCMDNAKTLQSVEPDKLKSTLKKGWINNMDM